MMALAAVLGVVGLAPSPPVFVVINGYRYGISDEEGPRDSSPNAATEAVSASLQEWGRLRAAQLEERTVVLRSEHHQVERTFGELGVSYDDEEFAQRAATSIRDAQRALDADGARALSRRILRKPSFVQVDLRPRIDEAKLRDWVAQFARIVDRAPRDAALLIAEHKIRPSRSGRQLSVEATLARARVALEEDEEPSLLIDASVDWLVPRVTEDDLAPVDVTRVLATYETSFRGKAGPRAVNIRRAGKLLDGAIVLPGEVLSFNQQVGRRVLGRGFVDAPVIINDEMEMDVGGGVCQVATTLHAAAVYGNLEVVRRRSHSRPSGYAPLGLDATVIDGKVDLQIRNPYDQPLLVHVRFPGPYRIRVEILGTSPTARVEHAYTVASHEPFSRRIWRREEVPVGTFEQKQKGSPGMDVVSVLRIEHEDGRVERRHYPSKYYPVPEVFWVSEEGARAELPKLPDGVTALVVDGEPVEAASEAPRPEEEVPSLEEADSSVL